MFQPELFYILRNWRTKYSKKQFFNDIIAGIIVGVIALPLSVALGIASGTTPEKGLITAIVAGFCISLFGGSRVQIGGPTGAFVVIVLGIIKTYGVKGLTIATILAGIMLVIFGVLKLGSVIKFFPFPITVGFTSGIAVTLLSTQINDFMGLGLKSEEIPSEFIDKWHEYIKHFSDINWQTLVLGVVSLLIIVYWPKINKKIPGSLIAIIFSTLAVGIFHLDVATIGSRFGQLSSQIPAPSVDIDFNTISKLMMPAVTIALLASIESLLSAVVADGMIGKRHNSNMELIGQGIGNIVSGIFGGIPATGAIARTAANIKNGGRTPIAGITHAVTLLIIMLALMPLASLIPMTVLAAILIGVAYNMSEWRTFKNLLKSTKSDVSVMLITFVLTVLFDLVFAIEVGMIIAVFLFMKRMADVTEISSVNPYNEDNTEQTDAIDRNVNENIFIYEINGPLFFGAINTFMDMMDEIEASWDIIIFRMRSVPVMDASAFSVLERIDKKCRKNHIMLMFTEICDQPKGLMQKMGYISKVGEDRFFDSLDDALEQANEIIELKHHLKPNGTFMQNNINA